jgi:hypothetical protein
MTDNEFHSWKLAHAQAEADRDQLAQIDAIRTQLRKTLEKCEQYKFVRAWPPIMTFHL